MTQKNTLVVSDQDPWIFDRDKPRRRWLEGRATEVALPDEDSVTPATRISRSTEVAVEILLTNSTGLGEATALY